MKKCHVIRLVLLIFVILTCVGCNRKVESKMLLSVDSDFVKYENDNLNAYTVDEEGVLYTSGSSYDEVTDKLAVYIHKFDLEGNLIFSHEFGDVLDSSICGMAVNGDRIYFTISSWNKEGVCSSLYFYDIKTDMLERLYDFNYFETANHLIYLDDRVYVLGNKSYSTSTSTNMPEDAYQSKGEKIVYYSLSDKTIHELGINIPISMTLNEDGSLMINSYLDKEGYCMLQYDPKKDLAKVVASYDSDKFENFAVCDNGEKLIYSYKKNTRGLVMSDKSSIDEEAEIYSDAGPFNFGIYYVKGQVYCMTNSMDVIRLSLNKVRKENRSIRYISSGFLVDEPFGCGYSMIRTELDDDKFALKVLAQDKDYDISLMNSSSFSSYNIRMNGVFYPLNDVEGINEYLDACFPYVKETATDVDGNIWMIPIGVDIPCLLVNKESLTKHHINLKNNMTYEEFYQVQEGMTDELYSKASCNSYVIYQSFLAQYFNQFMNLNNDVFRSKLMLFQMHDSYMPRFANSSIDRNGDFLYEYYSGLSLYEYVLSPLYNDNNFSFYSMPKLNTSDKNIGTCTYIAVNANSKNRKVVLEYLADWIKYIMNQEKVPLYFRQTVPDEDNIQGSLYKLYENGEITFSMDNDVYADGFLDVIENGGNIEDYIKETGRKLDTYFKE